jgi:hypothetical protein
VTEQQIRWGLLIRRKDGTAFMASGNHGAIFTRKSRREVLEYADILAIHIPPRRRLKVVKVRVTWEVIE